MSLVSGAAYSASGMEQSGTGSAAGDLDGDGDLDFLVTNVQRDYNTLFLSQTPPARTVRFADETTATGLNLSDLTFPGSAALALHEITMGRGPLRCQRPHPSGAA